MLWPSESKSGDRIPSCGQLVSPGAVRKEAAMYARMLSQKEDKLPALDSSHLLCSHPSLHVLPYLSQVAALLLFPARPALLGLPACLPPGPQTALHVVHLQIWAQTYTQGVPDPPLSNATTFPGTLDVCRGFLARHTPVSKIGESVQYLLPNSA